MCKLPDFEDLDIFTKGEFSTTAIVSSAVSPITELEGIFDDHYQETFDMYGDHQTAEGRRYLFKTRTDEIHGLAHEDQLTIHGKDYLIISIQPTYDGLLTSIVLKENI